MCKSLAANDDNADDRSSDNASQRGDCFRSSAVVSVHGPISLAVVAAVSPPSALLLLVPAAIQSRQWRRQCDQDDADAGAAVDTDNNQSRTDT